MSLVLVQLEAKLYFFQSRFQSRPWQPISGRYLYTILDLNYPHAPFLHINIQYGNQTVFNCIDSHMMTFTQENVLLSGVPKSGNSGSMLQSNQINSKSLCFYLSVFVHL